MGHHRRQASGTGWFGRLRNWWSNRAASDLQRQAEEALWTAQAQRPEVEYHADIVTRMALTFRAQRSP